MRAAEARSSSAAEVLPLLVLLLVLLPVLLRRALFALCCCGASEALLLLLLLTLWSLLDAQATASLLSLSVLLMLSRLRCLGVLAATLVLLRSIFCM
jgi:hypothetical protein